MAFIGTNDGGEKLIMDQDILNQLLNQREQLMEDIETIVEGNFNECSQWHKQDVTRMLCDAVIKNFPRN